MKLGTNKNSKKPRAVIIVCGVVALFFILLLFNAAKDIIIEAVTDGTCYDVRLVQEDTLNNGQQIYRLYRNGEYIKDVDYNEYSLLDSDGNTDYRYCAVIENVKGLIYAALLCAMMVLGLLIAHEASQGTPFTKKNARMIRAIGFLQLALTVLPGMTAFVLKFIKFDYVFAGISMNSVYMFLIACVIMLIAHVFDYGVKLQEDSDSIA